MKIDSHNKTAVYHTELFDSQQENISTDNPPVLDFLKEIKKAVFFHQSSAKMVDFATKKYRWIIINHVGKINASIQCRSQCSVYKMRTKVIPPAS